MKPTDSEPVAPVSRRPWRHAWSFAALAAVAAGSFWFNSYLPGRNEVLIADGLNFGEVIERKDFNWTLKLVNRGDKDIQVEGFATECSCVTITPHKLTIPTGKTETIDVAIDLTRVEREPSGARQHVEIPITPFVNGQVGRTYSWKLQGIIRRGITMDPQIVDFGETVVEGQPSKPRVVTITAHEGLSKLECPADPRKAETILRQVASNRYELQLSLNPHLPAGPLFFELPLQFANHQGFDYPPVPLFVRAVVTPDVIAVPSDVLLGFAEPGSKREATVVIQSLTGSSFTIAAIDNPHKDVVATESPCAVVQGTKSFRITVSVQHPGFHERELVFVVEGPAQKSRVKVRLSCHAN